MITAPNTQYTTAIPATAEGENWAQLATDAWIAEHGGIDVTGRLPDGDIATWAGDVETNDGHVFRLEVDGASDTLVAWDVEVVLIGIDLTTDDEVESDSVWPGTEWLAETRTEETIMDDCTEGGFVADRFVSRVTELAV